VNWEPKGAYLLRRGKLISDNNKKNLFNFELWGWILFIICAGFFIAASIKNHDTLSLIGSIIFLIACLVFIIPLIAKGDKKIGY
jgi:uncharacterized membrane protein YjjP (DUF1212 family)